MTKMNVSAKEFYPTWKIEEDNMFDDLEKKFQERNAWMFETNWLDVEYNSEMRYNKMLNKKLEESNKK